MKKWILLFLLIATCVQSQVIIARKRGASAPATDAGISYIGSCTGTTSCTPPAHAVGDLFLAYCGRDATTTACTLPSGWTSVTTSSINGTSTADSVVRLACKVATTTSETVTGFTSSANLVAQVYRNTRAGTTATCASGILGTPSNNGSAINTTVTALPFNAITSGDSASWIAGFAYTPAATAGTGTAPSGMTNRTVAGSTKAAGNDTNGPVSSFSSSAGTGVLTTAGRVITTTVEIKGPQVATPTFSPSSGAPPQTVTLASTTSNSSPYIYYTTDGSTPTSGSSHGTSVSVSSDPTTVKAKAIGYPNWSDSAVGSASYASTATINVVQHKACDSAASAGTLACAFTSPTTANNLVVVACGSASTTLSINAPTDGGTNTYSLATSSAATEATLLFNSSIYYNLSAAATTTITCNYSVSAAYRVAEIWEVSRSLGSWATDGANAVSSQTASSGTANGASVTTTGTVGFVAAMMLPQNAVTANPKAGNEFTSGGDIAVNGPAGASLISASAAAHQPVWTVGTTDKYCSSTAAFK